MYKALVFDLGNVLINFDYKIIIDNLNKVESGLGDRFEKLYYENFHLHEEFEKGLVSVDDFTAKMLGWLDNKISAENFCHIYSDMFAPNFEVIALLHKLKPKYKLYLLSNTNEIHQKYGWQKYEFLKHFDELILSHKVNSRKPEEKIFRIAEEITRCKSSEIFFTDDIPEYVETAKKIGWDAIQFTNYQNLLNVLSDRKIV